MNRNVSITGSNSNVWASLPGPLCDIFLQLVAPRYLTLQDVLRLSQASRRYYELFRPTSCTGNKILQSQLLRDAEWEQNSYFSVVNQLPTLGTLTVEESIQEDALLVAQLKKAASRRRGLVHIRLHDNPLSTTSSASVSTPSAAVDRRADNGNTSDASSSSMQQELQKLVSKFAAKSNREIMRIARRYHIPARSNTEFLCVNKSGRDVWCHWIDYSGQILVRDGDCIPSGLATDDDDEDTDESNNINTTTSSPDCVSSFLVPPDGRLPPNVFRHISQLTHAFAFSWQEGGTPFFIYQQRRSWHRTRIRGATMPIHAIALLPEGRVEELHCASTFVFDRGGWFTAGLYQFVDRTTGRIVATEEGDPPELPGVTAATRQIVTDRWQEQNRPGQLPIVPPQPQRQQPAEEETVVDDGRDNRSTPSMAQQTKELAKTYYGLRVPTIDHECWLRAGGAQEVLGNPEDPLNHPTAVSEAISCTVM